MVGIENNDGSAIVPGFCRGSITDITFLPPVNDLDREWKSGYRPLQGIFSTY